LILWVSFFILAQYAVSLNYELVLVEPYSQTNIKRMYQFDLFPTTVDF
jgi:hypothetical protein